MRVIVRDRGLPTPRRHLLVPATDQVLASSDTIYLPPHRDTVHLPARPTPGMDRLPVANTTAISFSIWRGGRAAELRRRNVGGAR